MGVLSWLGKIGAGIAAPFTGGASLAAIPAIDAIGGALGGGAQAAKAGRMDEAALGGQMAGINNRGMIDAAALNQNIEAQLMRRALMAQLLQQGPTTHDPRAAKFGTPGPSPQMLEMLQRYGSKADRDVTSGSYRVTPQMAGIPESGILEKIGGAAGMASGVLGALGSIPKRPETDMVGPGLGGQTTGAPQLPYYQIPKADPLLTARRTTPNTGRLA